MLLGQAKILCPVLGICFTVLQLVQKRQLRQLPTSRRHTCLTQTKMTISSAGASPHLLLAHCPRCPPLDNSEAQSRPGLQPQATQQGKPATPMQSAHLI